MNAKERFLNACEQKPVDRPPVWMMRQAGRYLPEYRAIREKMSTLEMMKTPDIACEITLQPLEKIGVDAAILYSDILMIPEAMGLDLSFVRGLGPVFGNPIKNENDVNQLNAKDIPERCRFVYETIQKIRHNIGDDFPLLGFAGAPFTVAAYMIGTQGKEKGNALKELALENRKAFTHLMLKLTSATIEYLNEQITSGVNAVQLFDTWAGSLSVEEYEELALPYTQTIFNELKKISKIHYIKGGSHLFESMLVAGSDVISVDWNLPISEAQELAKGNVAIQGNLDPSTLYKSIPEIEEATKAMIESWGNKPGYIVNLGHGILPDIPVENAQAFIKAAKKYGKQSS